MTCPHAAHAALRQSWRTEPAPAQGEAYQDEVAGLAALAAEGDNLVRAVFLAQEYGHTTTALRLELTRFGGHLNAGKQRFLGRSPCAAQASSRAVSAGVSC